MAIFEYTFLLTSPRRDNIIASAYKTYFAPSVRKLPGTGPQSRKTSRAKGAFTQRRIFFCLWGMSSERRLPIAKPLGFGIGFKLGGLVERGRAIRRWSPAASTRSGNTQSSPANQPRETLLTRWIC